MIVRAKGIQSTEQWILLFLCVEQLRKDIDTQIIWVVCRLCYMINCSTVCICHVWLFDYWRLCKALPTKTYICCLWDVCHQPVQNNEQDNTFRSLISNRTVHTWCNILHNPMPKSCQIKEKTMYDYIESFLRSFKLKKHESD